MNRTYTVLVCPRNDEESLQIVKIAKALRIPLVLSEQGHGAVLENEKNLIKQIKKASPEAKKVAIVEIPGERAEQQLRDAGFKVHIIDHHQYNELDRMSDQSSLEQFLDLYEINDDELKDIGFDTMLVRAVAAHDRGFLWELQKIGLSKDDQEKAIRYIKELVYELGCKERKQEEVVAQSAWEGRYNQGDFLVIESNQDEVDIRDAVSYLIFDKYGKPIPTIIRQGERKIYAQEVSRADQLIAAYGGFLFGGGKCWGMVAPKGGALPAVNEVVGLLKTKE